MKLAEKKCIEVQCIHDPKPEQNFELVYLSGKTDVQGKMLKDKDFHIEVDNSMKLKRNVEIY